MAEANRRLIWSQDAESDLLQIWHWGASHFSTDIADTHLREISNAAQHLCEFPESGRSRDDLLPGLRSIVIFPTVAFYRLTPAVVEIVRVVDGRRNIAAIFENGNA